MILVVLYHSKVWQFSIFLSCMVVGERPWVTLLRALSETLAGWKWRNLTLHGKIQVVKTFVMPKFMSRASLLCSTKKIIKELNSIIYRFIWKGCDKIKRLALISDYKNGGLRMPHIKTLIDTQRIICLKKYIED